MFCNFFKDDLIKLVLVMCSCSTKGRALLVNSGSNFLSTLYGEHTVHNETYVKNVQAKY